MDRVFSNVFAERLLLSLRKVDDPGTRAVISSLVFEVRPVDDEEDMNSDLPEGTGGDYERNGSAEILEGSQAEVRQRHPSNAEA